MLIAVLVLAGCASGGQSDIRLRETLEVPPDLARPAGDDPATASGTAVFSDYVAKMQAGAKNGNGSGNAMPGVTLERDGALRWLVVQDSPANVLAAVRGYFQRNNTKLAVENAQGGVIETDWNERKVVLGEGGLYKFLGSMHSSGIRDKFRVRVEPGRKPGTTEVYVTYYGLEQIVTGNASSSSVSWQPRAADPAMEADLLARLMTQFGINEKSAKD
ncbi:MAG: outer membrane protein assembly factor BamC, partial [Gammaproteobacteria bacterium]|nr:outer membrane protein assembly factor BamC [Gammaproteobacteria bacterium]